MPNVLTNLKKIYKMDDEKKMRLLHNIMRRNFVKKNKDYGDSFKKSADKWGMVSPLIRMEDKLNRATTLLTENRNPLVEDETIIDTLLDLANYAVMSVMYLKREDIPFWRELELPQQDNNQDNISSQIIAVKSEDSDPICYNH